MNNRAFSSKTVRSDDCLYVIFASTFKYSTLRRAYSHIAKQLLIFFNGLSLFDKYTSSCLSIISQSLVL